MRMIRKQLYLFDWENRALKELARQKNTTEASIIRTALDDYIQRQKSLPRNNPLSKLVGLGASASLRGGTSIIPTTSDATEVREEASADVGELRDSNTPLWDSFETLDESWFTPKARSRHPGKVK